MLLRETGLSHRFLPRACIAVSIYYPTYGAARMPGLIELKVRKECGRLEMKRCEKKAHMDGGRPRTNKHDGEAFWSSKRSIRIGDVTTEGIYRVSLPTFLDTTI